MGSRPAPVAVVQDAAPELWSLLRTALVTETGQWHEAVDRYHLNEHLGGGPADDRTDERRAPRRCGGGTRGSMRMTEAIERIAPWVAERLTAPGTDTAALEPHFLFDESAGPDARRNAAHEGAPRG